MKWSNRPLSDRALIRQQFTRTRPYADLYEGASSNAHFFKTRLRWVRELVSECPPGKVLDVGCGPALAFEHLLERGFECVGVDQSESMIKECRRRYGNHASARFAVGDVQSLAYPSSCFDVILCLGVLEYVDADVALRELARVLKPRGVLVTSMHNEWSPYRLWERAVYARARALLRAVRGEPAPAEAALRTCSARKLQLMLERHGLEVVDRVYYDFNLFVPPLDQYRPALAFSVSERLESLARTPLQRLGRAFLLKASKAGSRS